MVPEALTALAASGGAALVAAATDAWQSARAGFVRLLTRGKQRPELAEDMRELTSRV